MLSISNKASRLDTKVGIGGFSYSISEVVLVSFSRLS